MTAIVEYVTNELTARWTPSYPGRFNDVPEPSIIQGSSEDESRVNLATGDYIFVYRGGPESHEARSLSWTEERNEYLATVDIRTSENRSRLMGTRGANNEPSAYGGLKGEVERILETLRKGDQEFDWIDGYEFQDMSRDMGYGNWRGAWEVRLTEIAREVSP